MSLVAASVLVHPCYIYYDDNLSIKKPCLLPCLLLLYASVLLPVKYNLADLVTTILPMSYPHYISHARAREHFTVSSHILKELDLAIQEMLEFKISVSQSQIIYNGLQLCRQFISEEKHSRRESLHHLGTGVRRSSIEQMQVTDGILQDGTKMVEHAFITAQSSPMNSCFYTVLWESAVPLLQAFCGQISELEMGHKSYYIACQVKRTITHRRTRADQARTKLLSSSDRRAATQGKRLAYTFAHPQWGEPVASLKLRSTPHSVTLITLHLPTIYRHPL